MQKSSSSVALAVLQTSLRLNRKIMGLNSVQVNQIVEKLCTKENMEFLEISELGNSIYKYAKEFNKLHPNLKNLAKQYKH